MKRHWTGEVRSAGWSRRDYGSRVVIDVSLVVGETSNAHVGRHVDVELSPGMARWLAGELVKVADSLDGGTS